jgi:hypothetical protein
MKDTRVTSRHVAPLGYIILIPSQPVFTLTTECFVLRGEARNTNLIVWFDHSLSFTHLTLKDHQFNVAENGLLVKYKKNVLFILAEIHV